LVAIGVVGGSLCLPKLTPLLWLVIGPNPLKALDECNYYKYTEKRTP